MLFPTKKAISCTIKVPSIHTYIQFAHKLSTMHAQCSSLTYVNNDEKISSTNAVNVSICTGNEETRATPQSQCLASKRVDNNLFL